MAPASCLLLFSTTVTSVAGVGDEFRLGSTNGVGSAPPTGKCIRTPGNTSSRFLVATMAVAAAAPRGCRSKAGADYKFGVRINSAAAAASPEAGAVAATTPIDSPAVAVAFANGTPLVGVATRSDSSAPVVTSSFSP